MTRQSVELFEQGLNSDALLYCCLLAVSVSVLRLLRMPSLSVLWNSAYGNVKRELGLLTASTALGGGAGGAGTGGPFSIHAALSAFSNYEHTAGSEVHRMKASYSRLGRAHAKMGAALGYPMKLQRLEAAVRGNAVVAENIVKMAKRTHSIELGMGLERTRLGGRGGMGLKGNTEGKLSRAREAMRHFVRDWSAEGGEERKKIFGPILDVLEDVPPEQRSKMRVLVPGCGLGRLAWDIHTLGYDTTANELSSYMNLSFRLLLDATSTPTPNTHVLQPYAHWFSHQRNNTNLFRSVSFPDVLPRLSGSFRLSEGDFFALNPLPALDDCSRVGYDFVVTLFFIDTSLNILSTLQKIYGLLAPGGTWINLGPLLWTGGGEAAMELSLEEVMLAAEDVGFEVLGADGVGELDELVELDDLVKREAPQEVDGANEKVGRVPEKLRPRTVECEYTADKEAMMRWLYQAEFWVAKKPK